MEERREWALPDRFLAAVLFVPVDGHNCMHVNPRRLREMTVHVLKYPRRSGLEVVITLFMSGFWKHNNMPPNFTYGPS